MEPNLIYIADDQYLTFVGISTVLSKFYGADTKIEQVFNTDDLLYKISKSKPNLLVVDYACFDFPTVCDLIEIKKNNPEINMLVISENKDFKQINLALKSGIAYYLFKTSSEDELHNALRAMQNKRKYICSEVYDILIDHEQKPVYQGEYGKLSNGETEIVKLITLGKTTKEIAAMKNLSFHTINTHRKNIFRKLGINSISQLVKYAINTGLITEIEYYI